MSVQGGAPGAAAKISVTARWPTAASGPAAVTVTCSAGQGAGSGGAAQAGGAVKLAAADRTATNRSAGTMPRIVRQMDAR
ncbi:hypothetical protein MPRG_52050 [Mycobacterium paragordonae]|uniref:Uncharacterized protein n=1 Tax=Mycobacterium paragordonae TaxID=1389713 RepID=A0ABQ1CBY9_9MYCO|nr:hypothetical protein MPRG_52050 [Mycobacterium paragordonae]